MSDERKPQTDDKYIVRFPDGMRDRLKVEAKKNNRTLNAEIVARLEATLEAAGLVKDVDVAKELAFVRHSYERQIDAVTFGQEVLAHCLIAASDALPDELINAHYFSHALAFAHGVVEKDADKILKGYTGLIPKLQGTPGVKELEEVNAKYKRGEDIRPDLQRHLDDTRKDWDARSNKKTDDH